MRKWLRFWTQQRFSREKKLVREKAGEAREAEFPAT
jgi:hypothetical protein